MKKTLLIGLSMIALGCGSEETSTSSTKTFAGYHKQTLVLNDIDNVETVKTIPLSTDILALSSKSRKFTRLTTSPEMSVTDNRILDDAPDEGETTYFAVAHDGTWAAITRTIIEANSEGAVTSCEGELLVVDITSGASFGEVLAQKNVGPMPDSVAISADDQTILVGNERDVVWGKCADVPNLAPASLSVLTFDTGSKDLQELQRIVFDGDREPEGIAISPQGNVMVTLQDTHEVATSTVDMLSNIEESNPFAFAPLAANAIGQDAWPDGISHFMFDNTDYFAIAGEGNDVVYVLNAEGETERSLLVNSTMVPGDFPIDGSWGPIYRPDSMATFTWSETTYIATSLKASGAVGLWSFKNFDDDWSFKAIKVGMADEFEATEESIIQTEGITASSEHGFIVTANETESSLSLLVSE